MSETVLIRLIDQFLEFDSDDATGLIFVDNHGLLLYKLRTLGLNESSIPLFRNYLSDSRQYVTFNGFHSSKRNVALGVPQGNILGLVLFFVFAE